MAILWRGSYFWKLHNHFARGRGEVVFRKVCMIRIREAKIEDLETFKCGLRKLAEYEKLETMLTATDEDLIQVFFSDHAKAKVVLAEVEEEGSFCFAGFTIYSFRVSSFRGQAGLFIEDLFVEERLRGQGVGKMLLQFLAKVAARENCARMDLLVLDWNTNARSFYEKLGASWLKDWEVYRFESATIQQLGIGK